MTGYIVSFTVYTLAMIGVIFVAFIVAKKTMLTCSTGDKNQFLSIENSISLGARKTLHVVRAGDERFLIASDPEKSTFLTKLDHIAAKTSPALSEITAETENNSIYDITKPILRRDFGRKKSIMRGILEKLELETGNFSTYSEV